MRLPRPRMTVEWVSVARPTWKQAKRPTIAAIMTGVALIASILGFALWVIRPLVLIAEPAIPPNSVSIDHEIFDVVLSDLVDQEDFNATIGGKTAKKTMVLFHPFTSGHVSRTALDFLPWTRENGVAADLLDDLARRNPAGRLFSLADYRPSNPQIQVRVLDRADRDMYYDRFPEACGYVIPHLPGYSRDGQSAIFYFSIHPLGYHPGSGSYLLKRVSGRWTIIGRTIYYLL